MSKKSHSIHSHAKKVKEAMKKIFLVMVLLGVWQMLTQGGGVPSFLLPSPLCMVQTFWAKKYYLLSHTMMSLMEVILGLLIGLLCAMTLSLLMDYYKGLSAFLMPYLIVLKNIPIFVLAPLLMLWCGHGIMPKAILISISAMMPMTIAFYDGLRAASRVHEDFLACLPHYSWARALFFMRAPFAILHGLTGCRLAFMHAPMSVIACDWIGSSEGLGYVMMLCYGRLDLPLMLSTLSLLVGMSIFLYQMFYRIERYIRVTLLREAFPT